ncbi:MAG: hypothetical protein JO257_29855 [Deltaproteobacteria bacterium]|nr:hypothetical protein [Deltaproteobacteria bacterium]
MSLSAPPIRILVIRTWTELAPLRTALRGLGHRVYMTNVDIEPALNAALARTSFDVVAYDPRTPGIARETLAARMREHGRNIPVVEVTSVEQAAHEIAKLLASRAN